MFNRKHYEHRVYVREYLEDMPEIKNWNWTKDFTDPVTPAPLAKGHPRDQVFADSYLETSIS
jgi:xylulose-5-phosphate/fructose-6-phosphate phosphoketolase